jgi:hypothetical protein
MYSSETLFFSFIRHPVINGFSKDSINKKWIEDFITDTGFRE